MALQESGRVKCKHAEVNELTYDVLRYRLAELHSRRSCAVSAARVTNLADEEREMWGRLHRSRKVPAAVQALDPDEIVQVLLSLREHNRAR